MPVCLSHVSAFEFYRVCAQRGINVSKLPRSGSLEDFSAIRVFEALAEDGFQDALEAPVHVMVKERTHQRCQAGVAKHGVSLDLPESSVAQFSERVFVASPELCFAQMGAQMPEIDLALKVYELLGYYALEQDGGECLGKGKPLATQRQALRLVKAMPGLHGVKPARKVLSYACAGSASPAQTAMALLLTAPSRVGGMGFDGAMLNKWVSTKDGDRWADVVWPRYRIGLEVVDFIPDGGWRLFLKMDRRRRMTQVNGVEVIAVRILDFIDPERFDDLSRTIARAMGRRVRITLKNHAARQQLLRQKVLPGTSFEMFLQ